MSCGKLHEPDGFHLHPPSDDEHQDDLLEDGHSPQDAPQQDAPKHRREKQPSRVKFAVAGAWHQHGYMVKPFGVPPLVDGSGWFIHQVAGSDPLTALLTAVAAGLAAEVTTETVNHKRERSHKVRTRTRLQITVATLWEMLAAAGTPTGWEYIVQWAALGLGVTLAWHHVYEIRRARRQAPPPPLEMLEWARSAAPAMPPPPDPRLTAFITRFCQPGAPLAGATVGGFREVPHGFMLEIRFAVDDELSMSHVELLQVPIAKLYDTVRGEVTVEHIPDNRSESCCQVIVRKRPAVTAAQRKATRVVDRWDGRSTWNPATGTIDLGKFIDETLTRYQIHEPRSGAKMGAFAGVAGSGKTGSLHIAAAEAGIAVLCSRCGQACNEYSPGRCAQCDPRRVMAVWMGDTQAQGMSVWKGRADLTGWGVEGVLELLEFADQVYEARGPYMANLEWWDADPFGRRRRNNGKGFFDVEIGFPLIDITIDEWPVLVTHPDPEIRRVAQALILRAVTLWRKRGLKPKIAAATLDMSLIGDRELREIMKFFNMIAHRLDEGSSAMGGISGDPRLLPADTPGAGYINGPDRRDGTQFTTKYAPEVNRDGERGIDIRHMAGMIAETPIQYDPATLSVFEAWGVPHQGVFEHWHGRPVNQNAMPVTLSQPAPEPAAEPAPAPASAGQEIPFLPYKEHADAVLGALTGRTGTASFYELMKITDIEAGPLEAALTVLTGNRQVIQTSETEYKAA